MPHYCTYFDAGFLAPGLTLADSLARHDPDAVLWVLALDGTVENVLRRLARPHVRVVPLAELEAADPALAAVKATRSWLEYVFTLSPCLPRHLLRAQPDIDRLTYLDADLMFFDHPAPIFDELGGGSVLFTAHRFPDYLRAHYERHGVYNVGVLAWRRDSNGLACLDWWRERCLEWCHDRLEPDRYADQKYLDEWPRRFNGVVECRHPGVNLAPWNWMNHRLQAAGGAVRVDDQPLVVFHFARFRPLAGTWWWQSGQLDYGVMPASVRNAIYGPYWHALRAAMDEVQRVAPAWRPERRATRLNRTFWRALPLRLLFGTDWLRVGDRFISGRLGLGRYSGRCLARLRTICLRT